MSTTFVLHPFGGETQTDDFVSWPTYGYTEWTLELVTSRRQGTSPTLDVDVQTAPVSGDDDLYEVEHSFTQVDGNTTLPDTQSSDVEFGDDVRWMRVDQTLGGSGVEWWYKLTAEATLFDIGTPDHVALVRDRYHDHPDLSDYATQAEDDVVERYLTRRGILHLRSDEDTGGRIREAIARRIEWMIRLKELENSTKSTDGPMLRRHLATEWGDVAAALHRHDTSVPLYM